MNKKISLIALILSALFLAITNCHASSYKLKCYGNSDTYHVEVSNAINDVYMIWETVSLQVLQQNSYEVAGSFCSKKGVCYVHRVTGLIEKYPKFEIFESSSLREISKGYCERML